MLASLALAASVLMGLAAHSGAQEAVWMERNHVWKYFTAGDPGPTWKDPGFDDSAWSTGPAELGFGDTNPAQTTNIGRVNGQISYYFRTTITVTPTELSTANQLVLNLIRDDGAVVYINGSEVHRDNMPPGTITHTTRALSGVAGSDEATMMRSTHLSGNFLTAGVNTIAVEVHQNQPGSSDISFAMEMLGYEVIPVLGEWVPPAPIPFNEDLMGPFEEYWSPYDAFPGEPFQLGFWSERRNQFSFIHSVVPSLDAPVGGFSQGLGLIGNQGSVELQTDVEGTDHPDADPFFGTPGSHRVNVSNYRDVKVQFDLRTYDHSGTGLNTSNRAEAWIYTSVDGEELDEEKVLTITGGGSAAGVRVDLVRDGDTKRVIVPTASTSTTWMQPGFVPDASWKTGIKGAGNDSATTYNAHFGPGLKLAQGITSLYMRIPFDVTNPGELTGLVLKMKYDDGFIAYLNGTRVAARNAPATGAYNSRATTQNPDNAAVVFEEFNISTHLDKLVAGSNVLAIHGLNVSNTSSDMLTGAELEGIKPGGGGGEEPLNLNDLRGPLDGSFTTFSYDVADNVNTVAMKFRVTGSGTHNAVILDNILVTGTPLAPDSYANWIALTTNYELDDFGAPNADPDGDLIPNLLEYAFGGSATEPDEGILPTSEVIEIDGSFYLAINWRQMNQTVSGTLSGPISGGFTVRDIKYIPQTSTDGQFWEDAAPGPTVAELIGDLEGEEEFLDVSAYFIEPVSSLTPRKFARIKVELSTQ